MSASVTSKKELAALLRRCAAAIDSPSELSDGELSQVSEDADYAADCLDRERGIEGVLT